MTATRPVRPTDIFALAWLNGRAPRNEAVPWEALGFPPRRAPHAVAVVGGWPPIALNRRTWVTVRRGRVLGLLSTRPRATRAAWEIDGLFVSETPPERVALALFDRMAASAARAGMIKLFLRVRAGSAVVEAARRGGFVPYTTEHLLRLDAPVPGVDGALPAGLTLRPRERGDDHDLFRLYCRVAPQPVRAVEALTLTEWQAAQEVRGRGRKAVDLVGESGGGLIAWARTGRTGSVSRIDLVVDPDRPEVASPLLGWLLREVGEHRPVVATVPAYAAGVLDRMEEAGFAHAGEYALLARRLTAPIRARQTIRATVKPVVTM